jgi:hypothetical protein
MSQGGSYSLITGIPVPVSEGGTGVTTITAHSLIVGDGTNPIGILTAATDGQIPIGSTGADPSISTITAGTNIGVANGAGSITINFDGTLPVASGGTGVSSITDHALIVGSGAGAVTTLAAATNGQIPIGSTGADPTLGAITSTGGSITVTNGAGTIDLSTSGVVAVTFDADTGSAQAVGGIMKMAGGNNMKMAAAGDTVTVNMDTVLVGTVSHDFAAGGRIGTALLAGNTLLLQAYDVDGTSYTTFATLTANNTPTMDLSDDVTKAGNYIYRAGGTDVPVADGGTGASSLTDHSVLVGSDTAAITALAVGTDGQVLLGSSAADPVFATLTSTGSTITFTAGAGSLNLEVAGGGGVVWNEITGTSQGMAIDNGYISNNAALVTLTLPDTAPVGSIIKVTGKGDGGWLIAQNAGETIIISEASSTTTGVGGSLASSDDYDSVELIN